MKNFAIIISILTISLSNAFAQTQKDSITIKKVFGGYQYYQGEQILNMSQLVDKMKPNEQAYEQIKSAQSTYTMAMIFSYAGGFMIGWPLGTAIAGGKPNWEIAGIGAGLVVIAIPFSQSFNKKAKQAVDKYNSGLHTSSFWDKHDLKFSVTGNGFGLTLNF